MVESEGDVAVCAKRGGEISIVYASEYLNRLSGERIEHECSKLLNSGCRALVINFKDTGLVNSVGISILLGVIDAAEKKKAPVFFTDVSGQTAQLFELLGLTRYVAVVANESAALEQFDRISLIGVGIGH